MMVLDPTTVRVVRVHVDTIGTEDRDQRSGQEQTTQGRDTGRDIEDPLSFLHSTQVSLLNTL